MVPLHSSTSLKMCFLNVGGLKNKEGSKLEDLFFINKMNKYDIVFLAETHIGYESNIHRVGTFYVYQICRPICRPNNRYFGGLAILTKSHIRPHVKIQKNTNPDFQWIKLEKSFFGFLKDLYICLVYNPPMTSSYTQGLNHDILECIENETVEYKKYGNILLCGDFNARVSSSDDFIIDDDNSHTPLFNNYTVDKQIRCRKSKDTTLDTRGKELIDFCISNQIRMLNGRVLGDLCGNYTCYTTNGTSIVDYTLISESILDQILYFNVNNFVPTISDCHCIIEWSMSAKFTIDIIDDEVKLYDKSSNFIWSDDSIAEFRAALLSPDIQKKIENFKNKDIDNSQILIDDASAELSNIFISAASISLKRGTKSKKSCKDKKWHDTDLKSLRRKLINYGKVYSKFPHDPLVRGHYFQLDKQYSRLRKFKYREYKNSLIDQLQSLHDDNPKLYWNIINELKNKKNNDYSSAVAPSKWLSHFQSLGELKESYKVRLSQLERRLDDLEKIPCYNDLDNVISQKEITSAISKLKNKKAPGLDNISNTMIKQSQTVLLPCLSKLFNSCLSHGKYPHSWAEGYISVIHKSGDAADPNNYRGITITSSVGKVFNSILNERLDSFLKQNNIIDDCQIGFTRKA